MYHCDGKKQYMRRSLAATVGHFYVAKIHIFMWSNKILPSLCYVNFQKSPLNNLTVSDNKNAN